MQQGHQNATTRGANRVANGDGKTLAARAAKGEGKLARGSYYYYGRGPAAQLATGFRAALDQLGKGKAGMKMKH